MSEETYLTPYAAAIRWIGETLSDDAFKTFFMVFAHIDKYGTCWTGYSLLEKLTRHNRTCIYYEMQEIMARDLVRVLDEAKQNKYGVWQPRVYQINPYLLYLSDENFAEALTRWDSVEQTVEQKVPVFGLTSIVSIQASTEASTTSNSKQHLQQATPKSSSSSSKNSSNAEMQNAGEIAAWQKQSKAKQQSKAKDSSAERNPQNSSVPPPREKYPAITPVPRPLSMAHEEELAITIASGIEMAIRLVRGLITMYGYNAVTTAYHDPFVAEADKPVGALRSILQKQQRVEALEVSSDQQIKSYNQLSEIEI